MQDLEFPEGSVAVIVTKVFEEIIVPPIGVCEKFIDADEDVQLSVQPTEVE